MKKICCILVASFLVISMTIPMVFAGAQPQQTDQVTEETSSVEPERAINSYFVYDPGTVSVNGSNISYEYRLNTTSSSYPAYTYYSVSESPSSFIIINNTNVYRYFGFISSSSAFSITVYSTIDTNNISFDNGPWLSTSNYSVVGSFVNNFTINVRPNSSVVIHFHNDPQTYSLSPIYNLLSNSGVNEEWSSIGVVIFAMLPIVTIWLIIGRVFKRKER